MASRSVNIIFHNQTPHALEKTWNTRIAHGIWNFNLQPPQRIEPNDTVSFLAESDGIATGTQGTVEYQILDQPQSSIFFSFNNPFASDANPFSGHNSQFARSVFAPNTLLQFEFTGDSTAHNAIVDIYLTEHAEGIMVYEHANYFGRSQHFAPGQHDLQDFNLIGNDVISSVQIAPNTSVRFFDDANFGNELKTFSNPDLVVKKIDDFEPENLNDRISALIVETLQVPFIGGITLPDLTTAGLNGVVIYEHAYLNKGADPGSSPLGTKRQQFFGNGFYNLTGEPYTMETGGRFPTSGRAWGVAPDQLSSIEVGTGYYAILYDGFDQGGEAKIVTQTTEAIELNWDDKVKSILVGQGNPYVR